MKIAVIAGSKSDEKLIDISCGVLDEFGIESDVFITSAHRSPNLTREIALKIDKTYEVAIVIAGLSAALPGVIASYTQKPVLGVPVNAELSGLDALISIAQMPKGVPVATFGIGEKGAKNAALFAVRILSLKDNALFLKLKEVSEREEEYLRKLNVT